MFERDGNNIGAICKIEIAEESEIDIWPVELDGRMLDTPTVKVGDPWQELYFTEGTAHFIETQNGNSFHSLLRMVVPKDTQVNLINIMRLQRSRYIVRLTDKNKVVKYIGRPGEACSIRLNTRDHGQNKRDRNQYQVTIQTKTSQPVPIAP